MDSISLLSKVQSIRLPEDKNLPWRLNVDWYLFGLLSETNSFPWVIFLFFMLRGGESKRHRIPWDVKQVEV